MVVYKFGGSSVGSPARMAQVADIVVDGRPKIIVLSAISGMTDALSSFSRLMGHGQFSTAASLLEDIRKTYSDFLAELLPEKGFIDRGQTAVKDSLEVLEKLLDEGRTDPESEKVILAQGELVSTRLFQLYLQQRNVSSRLLPALEFMRTNERGEPDLEYIQAHVSPMLEKYPDETYFITQGFICRNARGGIDNLKRGGSDYTATLLGAALGVEEIQIWTDIDGLHNNDPRIVKNTRPVRTLSYREAAELAYFGAKILHPTCVIPAEGRDVPIRLKSTFQPEAAGTLISRTSSGSGIVAIAAKDGITAITIRSSRMLNAYGFLRRLFQVFEDYRTPIDMITTSEVAVSLTIDDDSHLNAILHDLASFGEVRAEKDQTIICLVGDQLEKRHGYAKIIFSALEEIPIRAVSYGGSDNNVSILVNKAYKQKALQSLSSQLFPS